ncbi:MAG TPA: hypothetical protein VJY39_08540 [Acidisphaera sp.]|nr:hypothetical protein [Acidisphaera sp.]
MSFEEARQRAIQLGALKPQGAAEKMAAGSIAANGGAFSQTARAQQRLALWMDALMIGEDPRHAVG